MKKLASLMLGAIGLALAAFVLFSYHTAEVARQSAKQNSLSIQKQIENANTKTFILFSEFIEDVETTAAFRIDPDGAVLYMSPFAKKNFGEVIKLGDCIGNILTIDTDQNMQAIRDAIAHSEEPVITTRQARPKTNRGQRSATMKTCTSNKQGALVFFRFED